MGYIRPYPSNVNISNFVPGVIDVDGSLSANSDMKLSSQKAVKTYVDNKIDNLNEQLFNKDNITPVSNIYTLDMKQYAKKNFSIEISDVTQKTIMFANVPSSTDLVLSVLLELKYLSAANIIFPTGTIWDNDNIPSFATGKRYLIQFISYNGGNTWMANIINQANINTTLNATTYNIIFNIVDGINPILGVTINILNQTLTTNSSGIATLTNISPSSNISYSISKIGYIALNGTINIVDQDITQNITLTVLPTYNVTFNVTDGTNPIIGAIVNISGQSLTTDSNGIATAIGLNIGNNISYSVSKTGYNTLSSSVNIINQNITQNITLIVTTSFDITTKQPKIILSLAKINPNYAGACINVRRSSDNTTQDIGFVNNYLDLVSLTAFVGQNNGYITKWYDSSGNGNDCIQTINDNQPRIVNNGMPEDGIWFSGSNAINLTLAPNTTVNNLSQFSILSQYKPISKNAGVTFGLISKTNGYSVYFYDTINVMYVDKNYSTSNADFYRNPGDINLSQWNDLAVTFDASSPSNAPKIYADGISGSVIESLGSGTPMDDSTGEINIGKNFQGNIKSIILCNSILTDADVINEKTLINSIMPPQLTSNVTFTITDGANPISGAIVTFNGISLQSNTNGLAVFNNVNYGLNQSYSISMSGYYTITNTLNVNNSTISHNISMTLIPSSFNVIFNVTDGVNNINGASINFNNTNITTDSSGNATFTEVPIGNNITYTISKSNYRDTTGVVNIVDYDVTVNTILSTLSTVSTNAYYISTTGSDSNDGLTTDTPFLTLQRAQTEARIKTASGLTQDCYIYLRGGIYKLINSWDFTEKDSGTNGHKIIYKNYNNEVAEITSSKSLTGWTLYDAEKNIYVTNVNIGYTVSNIYEGDQQAVPARYPNTGYNRVATMINANKFTQFGFNDGDIPTIADLSNTQILIWSGGDLGVENWSTDLIKISAIDYTNHIATLISSTTNSMGSGSRYFIQNALELLDTPGEFFLDHTNNKLYYIPRGTFDANNILIPSFNGYTITVNNNGSGAVNNIRFEGLTIDKVEGIAFFILQSTGNEIINCIIKNVSDTAIYSQENKNSNFNGNHVYNIGGDAIVLNGKALSSTSTSIGNNVNNNKIHDIGKVKGAAVGINLDSSDGCTVTHNQIYNSPRWAISYGGRKTAQLISQTIDGIVVTSNNVSQFRHGINNVIQYNECFNCNTDSEDTSPIYSYGTGAGTIVKYNSIHDSGVPFQGGYGIYMDDGADGSIIDSNVIYNMQLNTGGEFRGFIIKGLGNVVKNNIIADSPACLGALVPSSSTDPVGNIKFYNNIIYNAGDIMYDMYGITDIVTESNYNTFYSNNNQYLVYRNDATNVEDLRLGSYVGTYDQNSIEENPLFIGAYPNDYRLRYDSPSRAMGNVDIDFGSIGLTSSYIYTDQSDNIDKVFVTNSKTGYEPNIDLNLNEQITLSVFMRSENGYYLNSSVADSVTITSDNSSIATVSGNNITGITKGIASITISVTKNNTTKSTKIYVLVADTFKLITLSSPYSRLSASWNNTGKTKIIPTLRSELGRIINSSLGTISFSSSDNSKLTITSNGVATIIGTGNVNISADGTYNGIQKSGSITISALLNDYFNGNNLIQGGDMETDSSAWQTSSSSGVTIDKSYDTTIFDTGARSLKTIIGNAPINGNQGNATLQQGNISVTNGIKYRLTIDNKSTPDLQYWLYSPVGVSIAPTTNSNWKTFIYDFISNTTTSAMLLQLQLGRNNGTYWFDNIGLYRLNNYRIPEIPTNIQVIDNSTNLAISWTASITSGVQGYNVYINGVKDNSSLITSISYNTIVANNLNYYVQITSVDTEGNESFKTSEVLIRRL